MMCVYFEYRKRKYFNLDCLTGNLVNAAKAELCQSSLKNLREKEKSWEDVSNSLLEQQVLISSKINQKLGVENTDSLNSTASINSQKTSVKGNTKKTTDGEVVLLQNQLNDVDNAIRQYRDKITRNQALNAFYHQMLGETDLRKFDFVNGLGERCFAFGKFYLRANEVFLPNKLYYMVLVKQTTDKEEIVPLAIEGAAIVNIEEPGALDFETNLFQPKKQVKGK